MRKPKILAATMALTLLTTVFSIGASATNVTGEVIPYGDGAKKVGDYDKVLVIHDIGQVTETRGLTIDGDEFMTDFFTEDQYNARDHYLELEDGSDYDFLGLMVVRDWMNDTLKKGSDKLIIGKVPTDPVALAAYQKQWYVDGGSYIDVLFMMQAHQHRLPPNAPWIYDNNNHWKWCPICHDMVLRDWHHDIDNDGICDECRQPIVYRNITLKDAPGGKVTVSQDKGMLGDRIAITVTPDAGQRLESLQVINHNEAGSPRACHQDVKGESYHFFLDVWDVDVVPVFTAQ